MAYPRVCYKPCNGLFHNWPETLRFTVHFSVIASGREPRTALCPQVLLTKLAKLLVFLVQAFSWELLEQARSPSIGLRPVLLAGLSQAALAPTGTFRPVGPKSPARPQPLAVGWPASLADRGLLGEVRPKPRGARGVSPLREQSRRSAEPWPPSGGLVVGQGL